MAVIYKYPLPGVAEPFDIPINGFLEVVHVGFDPGGTPCIWALVVPTQPEETWTFRIVVTGEEFDVDEWCYLATFMKGAFVWHLLRPVNKWKMNPKES